MEAFIGRVAELLFLTGAAVDECISVLKVVMIAEGVPVVVLKPALLVVSVDAQTLSAVAYP